MTETHHELLDAYDPGPFTVVDGDSASPFVLACDHAGNLIPRRLGTLGLSEADRSSHIAWDIGIAGLSRKIAATLGAHLVLSNYSRLVIDCNRPIDAPDSIVSTSADIPIPGNIGLTERDIQSRIDSIFSEYHRHIEAELDRRLHVGQNTIYVAMHSFTPVMRGFQRPWHLGVLYQRDPRLAKRMLELFRAEPNIVVGENEPYRVSDRTDYSVVTYGEQRGIRHVELEVRQDLIDSEAGQSEWAERIARVLSVASQS